MGQGLTGRTLGVIGLGNIGREVFTIAQPLGMRHLAHDPYAVPADAAVLGIELLGLEDLLRAADYVVICCALTPGTRHLINAERLALLKPTAYLINVARGPIVDQAALTRVLQEQRIQGAGLDVFEQEPIDPNDPLLTLDNVIVAPHSLCWTDECFRGIGQSAFQSIIDVAAGRTPGTSSTARHWSSRAGVTNGGNEANVRRYHARKSSQAQVGGGRHLGRHDGAGVRHYRHCPSRRGGWC